jgi:hypothetical protein
MTTMIMVIFTINCNTRNVMRNAIANILRCPALEHIKIIKMTKLMIKMTKMMMSKMPKLHSQLPLQLNDTLLDEYETKYYLLFINP